MAFDLEAIRAKVRQLNGERPAFKSNATWWKPELGEHRVRLLPWKNTKDGLPFIEFSFYYLEKGKPGIIAPVQFGKPDPINDFIRKLWATKKPEDIEIAKKLRAKTTTYAPVIIRGDAKEEVLVWRFNYAIQSKLLGYWYDDDYGDILDVDNGFDIKVKVVKSAKKFEGRDVLDTSADAAPRASKLSNDPAQVKKWLDAVPDLYAMDMFKPKSPQEIEDALHSWLDSGSATAEGTAGAAPTPVDEVAKLTEEIKQPVVQKPVVKAPASRKPVEEVVVEKKSLDDAFAELMESDE